MIFGPIKTCSDCGGDFPLVFFRVNTSSRRYTRTSTSPRCMGCEQQKRDSAKQRNRFRVKARAALRSHQRKYPNVDLVADGGWNVDQMEHDIRHAWANGCPYCHRAFQSMPNGLSDVTLDIERVDDVPIYGANTKWCCATCNKEKQRTPPGQFGQKLLAWKKWEENQALLAVDPWANMPLFRGQTT